MAVCASSLGKVLEVFERNFRDRGELGASVSIWWDGAEVLSCGQGWCEREKQRPWTSRTLVPVYSATKVPAAATLRMALESRGMNEDTPAVRAGQAGKHPGALFSGGGHRGAGAGMALGRWSWLPPADIRFVVRRTSAPPHGLATRRLLARGHRRAARLGFLDRPAGARMAARGPALSRQGGQGRSGGCFLQTTHHFRHLHPARVFLAAWIACDP